VAETVRHYRELVAWQRAMDLVEMVYRITAQFPTSELYGLTNQLRRAAVSIPSNMAEGQGRGSTQEFVRFLRIANGSLQEVETQALIAQRLAYMDDAAVTSIIDLAAETGRITAGLIRALCKR
jgi:four helix bundle protein